MSKAVKNLTKSVSNTINASTELVNVSTEVLANTTGCLSSGIKATPSVLKELVLIPFSATSGYIQQEEGLTKEEADRKAYRYVEMETKDSIRELSEGLGKLASDIFADDEDDLSAEDLAKQHTKAELAQMLADARS